MLSDLKKVAVIVGLTAISSSAIAETATDTIEVYAGLAPVLELVCSDVKFGVWRVPTRTGGGVTTITLSDNDSAEAGGDTTGVALVNLTRNPAAQPAAGSCAFTGSAATAGDTAMAVSMAATEATTGAGTLTSGTMVSDRDEDYGVGISFPVLAAGLGFTLSFPTTTAIDANGAGSFKIAGVLTIPETIVPNNYGAYKQNGTITVTVNDGVGD